MKNKLFLSLIVASLLIYLASNLFEKKISKKENQQSFDLNIIKSGDIIFRKERNFLSNMFSNIISQNILILQLHLNLVKI